VIFYTIPGPKMLWQFGEVGYEYSINYCEDGTISDNCRISPKPVRWDYRSENSRQLLYDHTAEILNLRKEYDVFTEGTVEFIGGTSLIKNIIIRDDPYNAAPGSTDEMNAVAVANFDVVSKTTSITFPHTGTWYDFYGSGTIEVAATTAEVQLAAGGYKLFTDVSIETSQVVGNEEEVSAASGLRVYPNPVHSIFSISDGRAVNAVEVYSLTGAKQNVTRISTTEWDVSDLRSGLYILRIATFDGIHYSRILKSQ
jgi:hypothetical protein